MIGPEGKLHLPAWSSRIPIFPNVHGSYTHWSVRLLSMTLLVPQTADSDYTKTCKPDWEAIKIDMPPTNGQYGIRVKIDSGKSLSRPRVTLHHNYGLTEYVRVPALLQPLALVNSRDASRMRLRHDGSRRASYTWKIQQFTIAATSSSVSVARMTRTSTSAVAPDIS